MISNFFNKRTTAGCLLGGLLIVGTGSWLTAQEPTHHEPTPEWFENNDQNAWLQRYDPTLISRRLYSEFSYEDQEDDHALYEIDTSFRDATSLSKDTAIGYQIELPYKWKESDGETVSGWADFEFRTGLVHRLSPTLRLGTAVNMEFDSASHSELGANAFLLRPITAIRWDASKHINTGMNLEYTFTPLDEGFDDASYLEWKIPISYKISDQWSTSLTYKPKWNFVSHEESPKLELDTGYVWGKEKQFALTMGIEVPLAEQTMQLKSILGLTWSF